MIGNFKTIIAGISIFLLTTATYAAEDKIYTSFLSSAGAGGYDVVAYFTEGNPVKGNDKFSAEYENADWYFASKTNFEKFKDNPEKYIPQYGGYCPWAVAQGDTASGDPLQWTVVNDKLYLNYDAEIQKKWTTDRTNLIVLGDMNWPTVLN